MLLFMQQSDLRLGRQWVFGRIYLVRRSRRQRQRQRKPLLIMRGVIWRGGLLENIL